MAPYEAGWLAFALLAIMCIVGVKVLLWIYPVGRRPIRRQRIYRVGRRLIRRRRKVFLKRLRQLRLARFDKLLTPGQKARIIEEKIHRVRVLVALITSAFAIVSISLAVTVGLSTPPPQDLLNKLIALATCWAILPPVWFWYEFYGLHRFSDFKEGNPARTNFEKFKHGQQLSAAVWLGVLTVLAGTISHAFDVRKEAANANAVKVTVEAPTNQRP